MHSNLQKLVPDHNEITALPSVNYVKSWEINYSPQLPRIPVASTH